MNFDRTVGAVRPFVNGPDRLEKLAFSGDAFGFDASAFCCPVVVRRFRDSEHVTDQPDRVVGLLRVDELVDQDPFSLTKKAVAEM